MLVRIMRMGMMTDLVLRSEGDLGSAAVGKQQTCHVGEDHTCRAASGYHHTNLCTGVSSPATTGIYPSYRLNSARVYTCVSWSRKRAI